MVGVWPAPRCMSYNIIPCIWFLFLQPQYVFIHDALLESIMCGDNSIKAPELKEKVKELREVVPETGVSMFETQFNVSQFLGCMCGSAVILC